MSNEFRHLKGAPTVKAIVKATARYYGLDTPSILSKRRYEPYVLARHVAAFIAARHTPNSLPIIGMALGGRDHTSIHHAVKKVDRELGKNPRLRKDIAAIEDALGLRSTTVQDAAAAGNAAAIGELIDDFGRAVSEGLRLVARLKDVVEAGELTAAAASEPSDPATHPLQDRVIAAARAVSETHDAAMTVAASRVAATTFNRSLVALKHAVAEHDAAGLSPTTAKGETDGLRHH